MRHTLIIDQYESLRYMIKLTDLTISSVQIESHKTILTVLHNFIENIQQNLIHIKKVTKHIVKKGFNNILKYNTGIKIKTVT